MHSPHPTTEPWTHRDLWVDDVRLHVVEAGSGPLVILLHGFPEFWYSWKHQIPALARAGFRVIAPDLRGYNTSAKRPDIASYRIDRLVGDVVAIIRDAGVSRAHLVGHDWGGVVAWNVAMRQPERVDHLAILNAPHPELFRRALRGNPRQWFRSWYILFFQMSWLPEWFLRRGNHAALRTMLRTEPVRRGTFTEEDITRYRDAQAQPGALTAALNYYRAALRHAWDASPSRSIATPTLVLWGERDRYLGRELTDGLHRWAPNVEIQRLPDCSHWIQNDAPETVNRLLIDFLTEPITPPAGRESEPRWPPR